MDLDNHTFPFTTEPSLTMSVNPNETSLSANDTAVATLQQLEKVVSIIVPIFFSIVVFIGFFGNNLVILVVIFNKQMRNTTNLLILNLAVGDLLFIVCCVPFTATSYALPHNWPFGDVG
jgi:allatostatin receptor